jgi:4-hydroxybenzoate polyprenyltransferase
MRATKETEINGYFVRNRDSHSQEKDNRPLVPGYRTKPLLALTLLFAAFAFSYFVL